MFLVKIPTISWHMKSVQSLILEKLIESQFYSFSFSYFRKAEVVRVEMVTEDCSKKSEYCDYNFRSEEFKEEIVICQKPAETVIHSTFIWF